MNDVQPTTTEPWHFAALDCAVAGAEGSAQGALCIWKAMSQVEQEQWRKARAGDWPRIGLFLQPVLDAAACILEDDGREFEREHRRASS